MTRAYKTRVPGASELVLEWFQTNRGTRLAAALATGVSKATVGAQVKRMLIHKLPGYENIVSKTITRATPQRVKKASRVVDRAIQARTPLETFW